MERNIQTIRLAPEYSNIPVLESFIDNCRFLAPSARNRLTLIATEIFDNVVTHNRFPLRLPVSIAVCGDESIRMRISYATLNFFEMVRANRTTSPHFDRESGRYRGIGLRMCRNLAKSLRFRAGLFRGTIEITIER